MSNVPEDKQASITKEHICSGTNIIISTLFNWFAIQYSEKIADIPHLMRILILVLF